MGHRRSRRRVGAGQIIGNQRRSYNYRNLPDSRADCLLGGGLLLLVIVDRADRAIGRGGVGSRLPSRAAGIGLGRIVLRLSGIGRRTLRLRIRGLWAVRVGSSGNGDRSVGAGIGMRRGAPCGVRWNIRRGGSRRLRRRLVNRRNHQHLIEPFPIRIGRASVARVRANAGQRDKHQRGARNCGMHQRRAAPVVSWAARFHRLTC